MQTILTKANKCIPDWLFPHMSKTCPYCGAPIADSGPDNMDGVMQLTQRFCPNPRCSGHMSYKIVYLADMLGVTGIGDKTARSFILEHSLNSHLEIIPYWFKEKPVVYLWEVAKAAQLYGYDKKWQDELDGYKNMQDYFDKCRNKLDIANANEAYLKYAESFFTLKAPLSKNVVKIMISGSIENFNNKQDFVDFVNNTAGRYVQVRMVGKRKSDVDFLVKEPWSADHGKTEVALENGIPIVSSKEFLGILLETFIQPNVEK